jgi:hypothetical protein
MPIIDVSQKSYRSLVRAAHKRGMSIDRYIQRVLNEDSDADDAPGDGNVGTETVKTQKLARPEVLSADALGELDTAKQAQVNTTDPEERLAGKL